MTNTERTFCLTIAGYDPTAGAGVLADVKTFEMHQVYGMAVITCNTLQTDNEFINIQWIDDEIILNQTSVILNKYEFKSIKIGLIKNLKILIDLLILIKDKQPNAFVIWDPILKSSSGFEFHNQKNLAINQIQQKCSLITPNWEEFEKLWGADIKVLIEQNISAAVLIKGGHRHDKKGTDILYQNGIFTEIDGISFGGKTKHGTGCVLSAAICANIAIGLSLHQSCINAKKYIELFIHSNHSNLGFHQYAI